MLFLLLTMEIFFQTVQTKGNICKENTTKCNFVCSSVRKYLQKKNNEL